MKYRWLSVVGLLMTTLSSGLFAAPEAFEVGPNDTQSLPRGKEADGIIGDFVLRNDKIELLISHNAPNRRPNMSTFYGEEGITPGCLYDMTLRGAANDQLVIFSPMGQRGTVSHVRISKDGRDGMAEVETEVAAARNRGVFKRHQYQLKEGEQGVRIITTLRNEGRDSRESGAEDTWTRFARTDVAGDIFWADAEDPADKAGYAYAFLPDKDGKRPPARFTIPPGRKRL